MDIEQLVEMALALPGVREHLASFGANPERPAGRAVVSPAEAVSRPSTRAAAPEVPADDDATAPDTERMPQRQMPRAVDEKRSEHAITAPPEAGDDDVIIALKKIAGASPELASVFNELGLESPSRSSP